MINLTFNKQIGNFQAFDEKSILKHKQKFAHRRIRLSPHTLNEQHTATKNLYNLFFVVRRNLRTFYKKTFLSSFLSLTKRHKNIIWMMMIQRIKNAFFLSRVARCNEQRIFSSFTTTTKSFLHKKSSWKIKSRFIQDSGIL